jgi:dipeptidyl aminopeptidase/acylaminoacyl peptidase
VLKRAALLAVVLITAGCGSVEKKAAGPQPIGWKPVERHLVYEMLGQKGVWIADVDGGHARLLVRGGRAPVISPDGRWVVYVSCDPEEELSCKGTFVISTSGGKPRKLSSDLHTLPPGAGTWSPDSKRIVVTRGSLSGEEQALVSIDLASGKELKLAEGGPWNWRYSFSPDGKQIVYARAGPAISTSGMESTDLFVVDSAGGDPKQITHTGDSAAPVWGPKSIAFARLLPDGEWGRSEIWQVQPDGSGLKTITGPLPKRYRTEGGGADTKEGLIPVAWSEDGRALLSGFLFSSVIPVAVDPESGEIRDLVENEFPYAVDISRDGRAALAYTYPPIGGFTEDSATVLIIPYAGGKVKVVARGAGSPSWNR